MLVSEIGYFQIRKNGLKDSSVANQAQKSNRAEGFGHYNGIDNAFIKEQVSDKNFAERVIDLFKSTFASSKHEKEETISVIA